VSEPKRASVETKDSSTPQDIYIEPTHETANAISLEREGGYVVPLALKVKPVSPKEVAGTVLAAPIYLLAGLLSLFGAGCGGNEKKTEPNPPEESDLARCSTADGHTLIVEKELIENNNVATETIEYLKDQLDTCVQEVKDDLEIDPLWPTVQFRYLNDLSSSASGLGGNRYVSVRISDSEMSDINRGVLDGTRSLGDGCSNRKAIHELNHALTKPPFSIYTKEWSSGDTTLNYRIWVQVFVF